MKKILFWFLFLIEMTIADCVAGCLKCSSVGSCLICDGQNNYYLTGISCVIANNTNCLVLSQTGGCMLCQNNFYIDTNSQKCLPVSVSKVVTNCNGYSTSQTCVFCANNFYISNALCVAVNNTIQNCVIYQSTTQCLRCAQGFSTSSDLTACIAIIPNSNCFFYSFINCASCTSGYFFDYNTYFSSFSTVSSLSKAVSQISMTGLSNLGQLIVCKATTVLNCLVFSSFNVCTSCLPGYYLQNNQCFAFPQAVINGCMVYSSITTCVQCQSGMYLANSTNCVINNVIPSCALYDGRASITTCLSCSLNFYIQNNQCISRTVSLNITNCISPQISADLCLNCTAGFNLTSDSRACLQTIQNCGVFASSTYQTTALICSTCLNGYYLSVSGNTTACILGTLSNCSIYSSSANSCQVCNNGYYVVNNLCVAHITINQCLIYSNTLANTCQTCSSGFYLFTYSTVCVAVTSKPNCATYSEDGNTCLSCQSLYYLNNGACLVNPTQTTNCSVYNSVTCSQCNAGYLLNRLVSGVVSCNLPFDYMRTNCAAYVPATNVVFSWATTASNPIVCQSCSNFGMSFFPTQSEAICVASAQSNLYSSNFLFTSTANCYRFGYNYVANNPTLVCMQCISGFYISGYWTAQNLTTSTSCVQGCATNGSATANTILLDDLMGFVNICVSTGALAGQIVDTNCQVFVRFTTSSGTLADYKCNLPTSTFFLSYAIFSTDIQPLDNSGPLSLASFGTLSGAAHYHSFGEVNIRPSVFNYRSMTNVTVVANAASISSNCELVFTPNFSGTRSLQANPSCLRCTVGTFQMTSGTLATNYYPQCVSMSTCSSIKVGGIPSYLVAMLSCHICNSNGLAALFPTLYFEFGYLGTATDFNIIYQYSIRTTGTLNVFECVAAPAGIFTTSTQIVGGTGASGLQILTNCAIYGVLTPVKFNALFGSIINVCLACQTGFFPTYAIPSNAASGNNNIPSYAVALCNAIPNCSTATTTGPFNSCFSCLAPVTSGTTTIYFAFTDSLLTNCQQSWSPNCFILSSLSLPLSNVPNNCGVCLAGYYLNLDGFCDTLTFPNTVTGAKFSLSYFSNYWRSTLNPANNVAGFDTLQIRIYYLLSFSMSLYGVTFGSVTPCSAGYVLSAAHPLSPGLCVLSYYISNQTFPTTGSKFVSNCVSYAYPTILLATPVIVYPCAACVSNFIITADQSSCVTAVSNCLIAQSGTNSALCSTCLSNFLNSAGVCQNQTISNCLQYLNTPTSITLSSQQCSVCNPGYSLSVSQTTCTMGSVLNCNVYSSGSITVCSTCSSGYVLLTLSTSLSYCYPFSASLNATILASGSSTGGGANNGSVVASSCIQSGTNIYGIRTWASQPTAGMAQTICMPFTSIANCALYSQNFTSITLNSFGCLNCSSGFYLNSKSTCVSRTILPSGCIQYSLTSDICLQCQSGSFLNSNSTLCVSSPTGLFACAIYSSPSNCTQCMAPYFLSNGTCSPSAVVNNCQVYSANFTCTSCMPKYFLASASSCVSGTATNCLTFSSPTACATCSPGFGLQSTSGTINCVTNVLPNCFNSTTNFPFTCLQCTGNYYPNSAGVCVSVPTAIPNCISYSTATTCAICSQNSVLSVDQTSCNSTFYTTMVDPNCLANFLTSTPMCSICNFGFYFSSSACISCTANGLSSGCLSCNPYNNTVCLVCMPGYYQISNGSCLLNSNSTKFSTNTSSNSSNTTKTNSFALIVKLSSILWLFFLLF